MILTNKRQAKIEALKLLSGANDYILNSMEIDDERTAKLLSKALDDLCSDMWRRAKKLESSNKG